MKTRKRRVRERIRRNRMRRRYPGVLVHVLSVRGEPYTIQLPNGEVEIHVPIYATVCAPYLRQPFWSARIHVPEPAPPHCSNGWPCPDAST